MRSRIGVVLAVVLGILGVLALVARFYEPFPFGVALVISIYPSVPFAMLSQALSPQARGGVFWISGHSPPFLSVPGVVLVYFVPAIAIGRWAWNRPGDNAGKLLK